MTRVEAHAPYDHVFLVNPIRNRDESLGGLYVPEHVKDAHVQMGWIEATPDRYEENLSVGDLVVWVGYKQRQAPERQYEHWKKDMYWIHEDDILLVIEDW